MYLTQWSLPVTDESYEWTRITLSDVYTHVGQVVYLKGGSSLTRSKSMCNIFVYLDLSMFISHSMRIFSGRPLTIRGNVGNAANRKKGGLQTEGL